MNLTYKECPQDIRDLAASIVANYGFNGGLLEGAIAAALDSEREACAKVADGEVWDEHELAQATDHGKGLNDAAKAIGRMIRQRGEAE